MSKDQNEANRRSQLLVKKRFQTDYILLGVVTVLLAVNILIIAALLIMGGTAKLGFTVFHGAMIGLVEIILVGVVAWLGLRTSHTIAGPVMVMERNLDRVREGDLTFQMSLRKSDRFHSSSDAYNAAVGSLRTQIATAKEQLARLETQAGDASELRDTIAQLRQTLDFFKTDTETRGAETDGDQ